MQSNLVSSYFNDYFDIFFLQLWTIVSSLRINNKKEKMKKREMNIIEADSEVILKFKSIHSLETHTNSHMENNGRLNGVLVHRRGKGSTASFFCRQGWGFAPILEPECTTALTAPIFLSLISKLAYYY